MKDHIYIWATKTVCEAAWLPVLVFGLHVVASRAFHAYVLFPPLDIPMHFLGGLAIAFFFHRAAINAFRFGIVDTFHPVIHSLLVFSMVGTTTVLWEFCEFISDKFFGTHAQLGLPDTLFDMFLGLFGGLCFLLFSRRSTQQVVSADRAARQPGRQTPSIGKSNE